MLLTKFSLRKDLFCLFKFLNYLLLAVGRRNNNSNNKNRIGGKCLLMNDRPCCRCRHRQWRYLHILYAFMNAIPLPLPWLACVQVCIRFGTSAASHTNRLAKVAATVCVIVCFCALFYCCNFPKHMWWWRPSLCPPVVVAINSDLPIGRSDFPHLHRFHYANQTPINNCMQLIFPREHSDFIQLNFRPNRMKRNIRIAYSSKTFPSLQCIPARNSSHHDSSRMPKTYRSD